MHQGVRYAGSWAARVAHQEWPTRRVGNWWCKAMRVHWMAGMGQLLLRGPNAGPTCAQHIHPSLRQTPCVAMLKGLLFKFDTPYVLANVCEAVPETMSLPSKFVLPNPKKLPAAAFCRRYQNSNLSNQTPSTVCKVFIRYVKVITYCRITLPSR